MTVVWRVLGAVLVLIVAQDVFVTVLFPASGRGIIRKPLSSTIWHLFRAIAKRAGYHRRRNILAYCGPTEIAAVLTVWFVLLIIGWAMIYQPVLGTAIRASSGGVTDTSWATAIYYSGYLITTLGTGGVVPKTGLYRLLAILETASGFVTISMVITYFMSVYSSLTTRNAFAQGLHHATAHTDDAAQLLVMLADGADLPDARSYLATTAASLRQIFQTHRSYPVLRYFHYREPYYALPRILLTVLDTTALCASALDRQRYSNIVDSAALYELRAAALALLHELIPAVESRTPTSSDNEQWAERYRAATTQLAAAGLHTSTDITNGTRQYLLDRAHWDRPLRHLAHAELYPWNTTPRTPPTEET